MELDWIVAGNFLQQDTMTSFQASQTSHPQLCREHMSLWEFLMLGCLPSFKYHKNILFTIMY